MDACFYGNILLCISYKKKLAIFKFFYNSTCLCNESLYYTIGDRKKSHANEGEWPMDESQIDSLTFTVADPMGFQPRYRLTKGQIFPP